MKWVLVIAFLIVIGRCAGATFEEANTHYQKGDYKKAIATYQLLVRNSTNGASPALFYNLANAYFRNGQPGLAIANYRRAAALAPRDPDIQANLGFARDSITATFQEAPYSRMLTYFRPIELARATILLWWIFLGLLTLVQLRSQLGSRFRPTVRVTGGILVVLLFFTFAVHSRSQQRTAVILRESPLRLGPLEESQASFTLREGAEFPVLGQREGWLHIGDQTRQGWVPVTNAAVVP